MGLARVRSGVVLATATVTAAACGGGSDSASRTHARTTGAPKPIAVALRPNISSPAVSPSTGGKPDRITIALTSEHATGVSGKTRRSYFVEAHAVRPAAACVNSRDRAFAARPAGACVQATLDPARGEGRPQGWCPGRFEGTVTYSEAFACPLAGTCHPPGDFPTRSQLVGRFSFRVR